MMNCTMCPFHGGKHRQFTAETVKLHQEAIGDFLQTIENLLTHINTHDDEVESRLIDTINQLECSLSISQEVPFVGPLPEGEVSGDEHVHDELYRLPTQILVKLVVLAGNPDAAREGLRDMKKSCPCVKKAQ